MMLLRSFVLLMLAAAAAPCAAAQTSVAPPFPASARAPGQGVLEPGDVVRVTVWRKPELSGEFTIAADSTIKHPLYRGLKVAGLGLPEAEGRLRTLLGTYETNPYLLLEPLVRITVGGEVREPRLLSLTPETTIAQAIALSGGPTADGRLDRVRLVRAGQVVVVDLSSTNGAAVGMAVRSGDQIYVARRRNLFREVIAPASSVAAALAATINLALR